MTSSSSAVTDHARNVAALQNRIAAKQEELKQLVSRMMKRDAVRRIQARHARRNTNENNNSSVAPATANAEGAGAKSGTKTTPSSKPRVGVAESSDGATSTSTAADKPVNVPSIDTAPLERESSPSVMIPPPRLVRSNDSYNGITLPSVNIRAATSATPTATDSSVVSSTVPGSSSNGAVLASTAATTTTSTSLPTDGSTASSTVVVVTPVNGATPTVTVSPPVASIGAAQPPRSQPEPNMDTHSPSFCEAAVNVSVSQFELNDALQYPLPLTLTEREHSLYSYVLSHQNLVFQSPIAASVTNWGRVESTTPPPPPPPPLNSSSGFPPPPVLLPPITSMASAGHSVPTSPRTFYSSHVCTSWSDQVSLKLSQFSGTVIKFDVYLRGKLVELEDDEDQTQANKKSSLENGKKLKPNSAKKVPRNQDDSEDNSSDDDDDGGDRGDEDDIAEDLPINRSLTHMSYSQSDSPSPPEMPPLSPPPLNKGPPPVRLPPVNLPPMPAEVVVKSNADDSADNWVGRDASSGDSARMGAIDEHSRSSTPAPERPRQKVYALQPRLLGQATLDLADYIASPLHFPNSVWLPLRMSTDGQILRRVKSVRGMAEHKSDGGTGLSGADNEAFMRSSGGTSVAEAAKQVFARVLVTFSWTQLKHLPRGMGDIMWRINMRLPSMGLSLIDNSSIYSPTQYEHEKSLLHQLTLSQVTNNTRKPTTSKAHAGTSMENSRNSKSTASPLSASTADDVTADHHVGGFVLCKHPLRVIVAPVRPREICYLALSELILEISHHGLSSEGSRGSLVRVNNDPRIFASRASISKHGLKPNHIHLMPHASRIDVFLACGKVQVDNAVAGLRFPVVLAHTAPMSSHISHSQSPSNTVQPLHPDFQMSLLLVYIPPLPTSSRLSADASKVISKHSPVTKVPHLMLGAPSHHTMASTSMTPARIIVDYAAALVQPVYVMLEETSIYLFLHHMYSALDSLARARRRRSQHGHRWFSVNSPSDPLASWLLPLSRAELPWSFQRCLSTVTSCAESLTTVTTVHPYIDTSDVTFQAQVQIPSLLPASFMALVSSAAVNTVGASVTNLFSTSNRVHSSQSVHHSTSGSSLNSSWAHARRSTMIYIRRLLCSPIHVTAVLDSAPTKPFTDHMSLPLCPLTFDGATLSLAPRAQRLCIPPGHFLAWNKLFQSACVSSSTGKRTNAVLSVDIPAIVLCDQQAWWNHPQPTAIAGHGAVTPPHKAVVYNTAPKLSQLLRYVLARYTANVCLEMKASLPALANNQHVISPWPVLAFGGSFRQMQLSDLLDAAVQGVTWPSVSLYKSFVEFMARPGMASVLCGM